jgi:pimeloyl-ACP methyl ester carboxylesterase
MTAKLRFWRWIGIVLTLLGIGLGVAYATASRSDMPLDALKARWAGGASRFLPVGGVEAHYRDEGRGPAVVLVHGTSASLHTWDGWVERLRADHRVVRFDLPGFGLTGPSPSRDYSLEAYVAFVDEVVGRLGLDRFVIGGNSLGGHVALRYAVAHPDRVRALILVDASGYPLLLGSAPLAFRLARWPVLPALLERLDPRRLVEDGVRRVYGDPERIRPGVVERYYELALRPGNRAAFGDRMRLAYGDDTARIRQLRVPTLILWGARDRVIPLEAARRFAVDIPGARLVVYDDLGHVPMEEDPARTVVDVQRFLGTLGP